MTRNDTDFETWTAELDRVWTSKFGRTITDRSGSGYFESYYRLWFTPEQAVEDELLRGSHEVKGDPMAWLKALKAPPRR